MTTKHIKQNAHKLAYLAKSYPEMSLEEIRRILDWTLMDYNNAIWQGKELGILEVEIRGVVKEVAGAGKKDEPTTQTVQLPFGIVKDPKIWDFGPDQAELQSSIEYMFKQVNKSEADLEEHYLNNYLQGYPPREHLIAIKYMLEIGVLHEYQIEDGDSAYLFYTLKENEGKNWGQKQFKVNPLTGEPNESEKEPPMEKTEAEK